MDEKMISRRDFLKGLGAGVISVAAVGTLAGCSTANANAAASATPESTSEAAAPAAPTHPFAWHELDKDKVQEIGFDGFYNLNGCARGTFNAIVGQMADLYGYPYNQIPTQMFSNGHAGYTTGSLCGCLGGACAAIGLFVDPKDQDAIVKELEDWYSNTEFPIYQPKMELITTVSHSVNCSDSVGTWMAAAGVTDRSDERRQARCAGLVADVAKKTVSLLNVYFGLEEPEATAAPTEEALADNEYVASAQGMDGDVKVKVTMDNGAISNVEVLEQNETAGIGTKAVDELPSKFVGMSTAEEIDSVDAVSGATITSNAIKEAVKSCLLQVK
ncbi:C-GCAxxG-C-C family (seleno)protein [Galactobacillus timonensis]|jgi:uncharacterized protein with FMN-binding domain|uniref:C-GCAxxG-C-C family (seleno)protein n=1 Tax=Galactobacillus timonensis TaxID=2041840 RepID=UPI000C850BCD|nr:C-GCAxxG-C-C family (seleno)protein [Galactobacillus timonensis]